MLMHIDHFRPSSTSCSVTRSGGTDPGTRGARGREDPSRARIFAVVDTFDAMTSDRPYRKALSIRAARDEVRRVAGTQFDPRVAETFLAIPEDSWVEIRERRRTRPRSARGAPREPPRRHLIPGCVRASRAEEAFLRQCPRSPDRDDPVPGRTWSTTPGSSGSPSESGVPPVEMGLGQSVTNHCSPRCPCRPMPFRAFPRGTARAANSSRIA